MLILCVFMCVSGSSSSSKASEVKAGTISHDGHKQPAERCRVVLGRNLQVNYDNTYIYCWICWSFYLFKLLDYHWYHTFCIVDTWNSFQKSMFFILPIYVHGPFVFLFFLFLFSLLKCKTKEKKKLTLLLNCSWSQLVCMNLNILV